MAEKLIKKRSPTYTTILKCNIKGITIMGSMFPTITTGNVDGSLKHVLKNSQAFHGSTFCKSLFLIGCKTDNMLKVKSRSFSRWVNWFQKSYPEEIRVSIVKLLYTVCKSSIWIPIFSRYCFFSHLHGYFLSQCDQQSSYKRGKKPKTVQKPK